jgi:uncharacterized protein (TIGR02646 family)
MKHVIKGAPPAEFEAWKSQANDHWKPTYDDLQNPEKRNLHKALLHEQGSVCCYCGRSISLDDSHIEHFKPQERYGMLQLEYSNLHASCLRGQQRTTPRHCGHAKGNGFDETRYIAPVDPDCEQRFMYTLRGAIIPTHSADARAQYMIDLLALDGTALRNLRDEVLNRAMDPEFLASATTEELTRLRDNFRRRDAAGNHLNFGHVLARYAEQALAEPLADANNDDVAVQPCASGQD